MRLAVVLLAACLLLGLSVPALAGADPSFAGRTLADALDVLAESGLKLVFTYFIVRPEMRVEREPESAAPREILDELLAPHGLMAREGPGVVNARAGGSGSERSRLRAAWGVFHQTQRLYELEVEDGETSFQPAERSDFFGERLPDYSRLDLHVSRTWSLRRGELAVFADVQNFTNAENVRGFEVAVVSEDGDGAEVVRDEKLWGPRIPSLGLRWTF